MESRSYNFSTAKKRSTMLQSKGIQFPKQQLTSPRMRITKKQCPQEFQSYFNCLNENRDATQKCSTLKQELFQCGKPAFVKANKDKDYDY